MGSIIPKNNLKVRYTTINKGKSIKLGLLGDFHISDVLMPKIFNDVFNTLKKEKVNYIFVLGDVIDSPKYVLNNGVMDNVKSILEKLGEIAKTFVILGNHDYIGKIKDEYDESYKARFCDLINSISNVKLLKDEAYEDKDIYLYGYLNKYRYYKDENDKNAEDPKVLYKDLKPKISSSKTKINIFLMHSPHSLKDEKVVNLLKDYDIIACGHMHNGCTFNFLDNINSNRGLINPKKELFPSLVRGIKKYDRSYLIMSGGITKISKANNIILHPLNILFNPQMDIVTLNKEDIC